MAPAENLVCPKDLSLTLAVVPLALAPLAFAVSSLGAGSAHPAPQTFPRPSAAEAPAPTLNDPTIVAIFDAANTADIATGKLAAQRGHSNEVRQFGAMLARDHDMVRQQGRDLAKKLGITPTPPAGDRSARDQAALIDSLSSLSGTEFDRTFLEHEIVFHRSEIAAIQTTLLPAIRNQELKALVVKFAPAFQAHLAMAEDFSKRLATK